MNVLKPGCCSLPSTSRMAFKRVRHEHSDGALLIALRAPHPTTMPTVSSWVRRWKT